MGAESVAGLVASVLKDARARLERGWTQRAAARRSDGEACEANDECATCWCAWGAIQAVPLGVFLGDEDIRDAARRWLRDILHIQDTMAWNDAESMTQAKVLAGFDLAIAKAVPCASS